MEITTLGTSHGDATYCRFNSSTLYESGDRYYLVDCGEPVDALLVRANKPAWKLKAIFVTHMHIDHMNGLPVLLKTLLKYPHPGQHTDIYLPEEGAEAMLRAWMNGTHCSITPEKEALISFHVIQPGFFYDDGVLRAESIRTQHLNWAADGNLPSYAFRLELEGKKLLHTGDLKGDFSDFPAVVQTERFDLCLCEATHYNPVAAAPIFRTAKLDRLLFIHVHNPWHGPMGEASLMKLCADFSFPVAIAHDGDRIRL